MKVGLDQLRMQGGCETGAAKHAVYDGAEPADHAVWI